MNIVNKNGKHSEDNSESDSEVTTINFDEDDEDDYTPCDC